jgi:hypothetical protein
MLMWCGPVWMAAGGMQAAQAVRCQTTVVAIDMGPAAEAIQLFVVIEADESRAREMPGHSAS